MNILRKYLGILWMLTGPLVIGRMCVEAYGRIQASASALDDISDAAARTAAQAAHSNIILQWSIIIGIFVPIALGFVLFGYFAWKREYDVKEQRNSSFLR